MKELEFFVCAITKNDNNEVDICRRAFPTFESMKAFVNNHITTVVAETYDMLFSPWDSATEEEVNEFIEQYVVRTENIDGSQIDLEIYCDEYSATYTYCIKKVTVNL